MRKLLPASILLVGLFIATLSLADNDAPSSSDIKKAAASYDLGRERFREGNFVEAAEKFEAADAYAPSAAALRLAIFARKEAGQLARAATLAALALERHSDEAELSSEAQSVLDELSSDLAKVVVACDSACELTMNNRLVHGRAAESWTLYVDPGALTIRASWSENRTQSEQLRVSAGDQKSVDFYAPVPEAVASPQDASWDSGQSGKNEIAGDDGKKGWHPAVFWTGASLTAIGVGASAYLGVYAINNPGKEAVKRECEANNRGCETFREGLRNQTRASVAIGSTAAVGVFTIITGIWLTNWSGKGGEDKDAMDAFSYSSSKLTVRPTLAVGDGAFLGASGSF